MNSVNQFLLDIGHLELNLVRLLENSDILFSPRFNSAIQCGQQAVLTSNGQGRVHRSYALAVDYHYRYEKLGALSDLEAVIQYGQQAIELTPKNHPDRANRLWILASGYMRRYQWTGAADDLELSIQFGQQAVDLIPENLPERASRPFKLASVYRDRYWRTEVLDDLELSIQLHERAVDLTPENHPDRALQLVGLGVSYRDRYGQTGAPDDFRPYTRRFQEALNNKSSLPMHRLLALFESCANTENWPFASNATSLTLDVINLLISRGIKRSGILHRVTRTSELASDAATIALRAGRPVYEAVQLLGVGGGIIADSLDDMRTDINQKFLDPGEQFDSLQDLLDSPKESRGDTQQYNTGKQQEELVQKIRSIPDFDRFLLPPSEDEMRKVTIHGPIVIINVSKHGCHALIIEQQKAFQALDLPLLNIGDIRTKAEELASPSTEMLEWPWDKIACPVLTSLNFVQTPEHVWPRVWWVLTGRLARFPIHAAGRYSEGEGELYATVMDRVISSYSYSMRVIIDAHRNFPVHVNATKEESMVLVGMEQTPGYSSLQFVQNEIDMLAKLGTSMQLQVKQPPSLLKETLSALKSCKIFHFAGHGYTDPLDPLKSALVLSDGKLTVDTFVDINHHQHKPFLAYLSACGTGQVKHEKLVDEGLHLTSVLQQAGFRHVIGTLWKVNDRSCVNVARMTYEWMQKQGISDRSVSEGLHHACRKLRSQWVQENEMRAASRGGTQFKGVADAVSAQKQSRSTQTGVKDPRDATGVDELPMYWVPYVHFGI